MKEYKEESLKKTLKGLRDTLGAIKPSIADSDYAIDYQVGIDFSKSYKVKEKITRSTFTIEKNPYELMVTIFPKQEYKKVFVGEIPIISNTHEVSSSLETKTVRQKKFGIKIMRKNKEDFTIILKTVSEVLGIELPAERMGIPNIFNSEGI